MCELILFITQYYAWFNSTCYHPPRAYPRGFAIFFSLGSLFPTPDIDFHTIAKPDVLTRTNKRFSRVY